MSSIKALGKRLKEKEPSSVDDLMQLFYFRQQHIPALTSVFQKLPDYHDASKSARIKNVSTIIEKIRRGTRLETIQDIAGIRFVLINGGRSSQDELIKKICESSHLKIIKIDDRRIEHQYFYRAVHVICVSDSYKVEIQIRTALQHKWAQIFERFADIVGRGIRYGKPPIDQPNFETGVVPISGAEIIQQMQYFSETINEVECNNAKDTQEEVMNEM